MDLRFAPVPVLESELIKELRAPGLRVTESWHRASSTIARHAHRQATLTVLLDGSFEESYPFRRAMTGSAASCPVSALVCWSAVPLAVTIRTAYEIGI